MIQISSLFLNDFPKAICLARDIENKYCHDRLGNETVKYMQRITALYEFVARFRRWVSNDPYKCCRGCCVTCPYYKDCEADAQKR